MRIFSDPHLGLNRKANTTPKSRDRLKTVLRETMLQACSKGGPTTVVCGGDLFDKFSNPEEVIISAVKPANYCDVILAGNHDSLNEAGSVGSLNLLSELTLNTDVIFCNKFDTPYVKTGQLEGMELAFIPHHASQTSFDSAVQFVADHAQPLRAVFLHCNYENEMTEGSDTALNLTKAQAEAMLTVCDYIFIGHEHEPRSLLDGRLIIIGCVHPTSFSDISNKYYYDLWPDKLDKTALWDMDTGYSEIKYDGRKPPTIPDAHILDITGQITIEQGVDLAQYVKECWEHPDRLMVRNNVSIVSESEGLLEAIDFDKLPDEIERELKGTPLEQKWLHYRGLVEC